MIDWMAFLIVLVSAMLAACIVVSLYALGLRLMSVAGKVPVVEPAEFTDQITVITSKEAKAERKAAKKAAKKIPLTEGQKKIALAAAYACFAGTGLAVLFGIYMIVPALHAFGQ